MNLQTLNAESSGLSAPPVATSRRNMLGQLAAAGAAVAALGAFGLRAAKATTFTPAGTLTFSDIPGTGDVKVLNYALALEALETDLYVQALYRLTTGGINAVGKYIPGLKLKSSSPAVEYVKEFSKVELQHRNFIDSALGSASLLKQRPFSRAVFDFGMQDLSASETVNLVYTAEKTGVGAYLGAIVKFASKSYLQIAGAIQGTEARHTAVIADVINREFNGSLNVAPLASDNAGIDKPIAPDTVLMAVSPFIKLSS